MGDILDLRQFRSPQLEPLLAAESEEWRRMLDWDYAPSAALIRQYIDARILPGFVLTAQPHARGPAHGYGFFIYESHKGLIGDLFVHPAYRRPACGAERELLEPMIETLQATPGLQRIEAQLMPFRPEDLGGCFASRGFSAHRRLFLELPLAPATGEPEATPDLPGLRLEAWAGGEPDEDAAHLILEAYRHHVDSHINDQYRSFPGALRFLHNIARYPGCGTFDTQASLVARSTLTGRMEAMALVSRVRPDVAHLTQICVAPERRHTGLGRALLLCILHRLPVLGARSITLTVTRENEPACRLYRQLGFAVKHEFDAYVWNRTLPS